MIALSTGVRVWVAAGHTDMRRGMQSLALQVQEGLKRDPHAGDLYVFRGRSGSLIKILWHDGIGMSSAGARQIHLAVGYVRRCFDLDIAARLHARSCMLMPLLVRLTDSQVKLVDAMAS